VLDKTKQIKRLETAILKKLKTEGSMYEIDLISYFTDNETQTEYSNVGVAIRNLADQNKLSLKRHGGTSIVCAHVERH
jgi:hypothetical protein